MSRRPRRNHKPAFKAKVALEAIKGEYTMVELTKRHDLHANQITQWKVQLLDRMGEVFDRPGQESKEPDIDVKALHAKIGELTLENDFLEGALDKAGLLSAKK
jgi:transposase-like protein